MVRARGLCPLPATPETVVRHISAVAAEGLSTSSIGRRLAALGYMHRLAKLSLPCGAEEVKIALAGIRPPWEWRPGERRRQPTTGSS
jgi:hypothetical protein